MSDLILIPTLTTERLVLRSLSFDDASAILQLRSNESVNKYLDRPKAINLEDAKAFIEKIQKGSHRKDSYYWAICYKGHDNLLGTTCLWSVSEDNTIAEMGYELHPEHQGKGIMQEAVAAVIDLAFNVLHFKIITAVTMLENVPSIKLLTQKGFLQDNDYTYVSKEDANGGQVFYLSNKFL